MLLLEITYEGTNQVKLFKISMFVNNYDLFSIKNFEFIGEMFTKFMDIINKLHVSEKTYTKVEKVKDFEILTKEV